MGRDIMMPIMDGVEVSQRLHAHPATAQNPIILISASRPRIA
jgi:CheY-like chemotaxis protein